MMPFPKGSPKLPRNDAFDREIAFHVAELTDRYVEAGMTPEAAQRRARLEFGGHEQVKQSLRDVHTSKLLESLAFHFRAAMRFIRQAPAFSATAVITLALGIGANTAVFSAIDAVILRPLPFPGGDQLMHLNQRNDQSHDGNQSVAPARLEDWNRLNTTFRGITGYYKDDFTETSGALPERLLGEMVAPRFLEVMGVQPALGRDFRPDEEHFGGPDAVLISNRLWKRRFNSDPSVLGKKLHTGRSFLTVVGVMPASFQFPDRDVDLWTPSPPDAPYARSRDSTWFTVIGRLKPNVTVAGATADLQTVQRQLGRQFPKPDAELGVEITPLKEIVVGNARGSLWLLYGSVSLLLLIACSNLAALLLARTADREHEISIRFALGASRRQIIAQLLAEVFSLALLGSLLGLLVAFGTLRAFHLLAHDLPRVAEVTLNGRVALYSLLCAVATTLLCGVYPALRGTRRELAQSLAQTGRTQTSPRTSMQWVLVGVQVMLAVVLLTGAGLLVRSMRELGRVSPGFDPSHVLAFQITGSWGETADMGRLVQGTDRRLDGLRTLPGVEAASTAGWLPGVPSVFPGEYKLDGHAVAGRPVVAEQRTVSTGYLATMHIPLLAGQACRDGATTTDFLINQSFVRRYFGAQPPVGHALAFVGTIGWIPPGQIIGIVGDAREGGLDHEPMPTVYYCFNAPTASPNYLVRTRGDAMGMAEAVRRRVHELDPARSVYAMEPLEEHLNDAFSEDRLRTVLLTCFAATAIALACIGLYGTLNYLGRVRHREVGLRLTLGASRAQVALSFMSQGMRVTVLGCIAGALLSVAGSRLLTRMLYGVSALDVGTYLGVVCFVLSVGSLACAAPARRAANVEPVVALRG